jgi:hypothetical protein
MAKESSGLSGLTAADHFLVGVRDVLKRLRLNRLVSTARALLYLGPWRIVPQFLIQIFRPPLAPRTTEPSLLGALDAGAIAAAVRQDSMAVAGLLSQELVGNLRTLTDNLPPGQYKLMHHLDADVRRLTEDPGIMSVLRNYLRAEPELLEATIFISEPRSKEPKRFHFDYAGWQSLCVFVYLSDVTEDATPHVVIKGSHREMGLRDFIRRTIDPEDALRQFGPAVHTITGPAGTVFFENFEAFHRRGDGDQRRALLILLYASHRSWFSRGRTSRIHAEKRARAYMKYRSPSAAPVVRHASDSQQVGPSRP